MHETPEFETTSSNRPRRYRAKRRERIDVYGPTSQCAERDRMTVASYESSYYWSFI